MTEVIDGNAVAEEIRAGVSDCVETLTDTGVKPGLATVLMSDDPASETYVSMKQRDCEEVGIEGIHVDVDNDAPAEELYDTVERLNDDDDVHGVLVQKPFVDQVDERRVLRTIAPEKDVDAFHPANVGRLVAGDPRFKPCTPHGIQRLLESVDVETEGKEAVVVGRSDIVGKPMANMLFSKSAGGNATTTVCHSRTEDLAAHTRRADIVVAAAGRPEFITGDMVSEGCVVVDVGINRVERDGDSELVGDVAYDEVAEKAAAITPVPGGVGPMTRAMLLYNTVKAASAESGVDVELP
ncbi:bifunctional methylenetetrahydrofolate dehydrogenase/methenyltetrahydrofolate cyclohydrolase FolD [Candidatus Halobonum tyrrellensis]|uniref:Bifunctional protein FolD n=1 Tax=Candidatus Halobonum tyrrellensis G22 TaxID=1324957 RepID=V4HFJ7_9EURY|nr:bifunctional methylenetetrahydrofolate dehydrogenase/methenyltetrahydrofolate cyclohydrolase FolD [Candidatus Halobonum tyrrellensis]ESP88848.1 bifunctional 5,10-methylene-tetrahydrofolate dehydrogenase/ 5,10-methylene-tetrahydrofolate cyclohydrolase [Candidatus Halobonum tyrrellensis G22]